jgi:hypothetical protein
MCGHKISHARSAIAGSVGGIPDLGVAVVVLGHQRGGGGVLIIRPVDLTHLRGGSELKRSGATKGGGYQHTSNTRYRHDQRDAHDCRAHRHWGKWPLVEMLDYFRQRLIQITQPGLINFLVRPFRVESGGWAGLGRAGTPALQSMEVPASQRNTCVDGVEGSAQAPPHRRAALDCRSARSYSRGWIPRGAAALLVSLLILALPLQSNGDSPPPVV